MKRKWLIMAAVAAVVCGVGAVAQAVPISGSITFAGGVELDTTSAGTATEVLAWTGTGGTGSPTVISGDGSFSATVGDAATFSAPWFFNSGAVSGLWSVGGFTFDLTSSHIVFQGGSPAIVGVDGIGAVMGNDESPEAMTWSFSTSDPGAAGVSSLIFSFQVAGGTEAAVPDGGTTAMLLGLGVLGLGLVKKQILA
jgi:VPDSG-CTERM motif